MYNTQACHKLKNITTNNTVKKILANPKTILKQICIKLELFRSNKAMLTQGIQSKITQNILYRNFTRLDQTNMCWVERRK